MICKGDLKQAYHHLPVEPSFYCDTSILIFYLVCIYLNGYCMDFLLPKNSSKKLIFNWVSKINLDHQTFFKHYENIVYIIYKIYEKIVVRSIFVVFTMFDDQDWAWKLSLVLKIVLSFPVWIHSC